MRVNTIAKASTTNNASDGIIEAFDGLARQCTRVYCTLPWKLSMSRSLDGDFHDTTFTLIVS